VLHLLELNRSLTARLKAELRTGASLSARALQNHADGGLTAGPAGLTSSGNAPMILTRPGFWNSRVIGRLMAERKSYTTRELAQMWNVSESTVKRWADIGDLKCNRTPGGHRRFALDHITEFQQTKGFEATGILIEEDSEVPDLDIYLNQKKSDKIREALIFLALHNQSGRIRELLERLYIRGVTLAELYDEIILPVLETLDASFKNQSLSFGPHRVAINNLEAALYYFFPKVIRRRPNGNTALCAAPVYGNILLVNAVARILEAEGWECLNLGIDAPFEAMAEMVEREPVNLVSLNFGNRRRPEQVSSSLSTLTEAAEKYRIPVVLTGRGPLEGEIRRFFGHREYFPSLCAFRQYVSRFAG
jgi:MerR family transcriptional regulator, light-induced transcriptional regulator